jgi:hypothetical protein
VPGGWRDLEVAQQVAKDISGLAVQVVFRRELMSGGHELTVGDGAQAVVNGLKEEQFLILPHQEVLTYYRPRAEDIDR